MTAPTPMSGASVPAADRPLTAPLWMVHVLGPDEIYPAPDHATAVQWCADLNGAISGAGPASNVLCVAVPALWTGTDGGHAAGLADARDNFSLVRRPAASDERVGAWEPVAEAVCTEVIKRAEVTCRKATDELYEGLLYSVQDYLRENVMLNLSGELERAHGYERDARAALVEIAKAARVPFVDSRDGVDRQRERILAALASPPGPAREPMSEREVRRWIDACNHEPGRQVLRDYLALRSRLQALAALTAREEAPADGAGELGDALLALLFRNGIKVALDVSEIEDIRQAALRARTSEPARLDGDGA